MYSTEIGGSVSWVCHFAGRRCNWDGDGLTTALEFVRWLLPFRVMTA